MNYLPTIISCKCLFYLREKERGSLSKSRWGAERAGKRESQAGFALSAQTPNRAPSHKLWNDDLSWNSGTFNRLSHSGTPQISFFITLFHFCCNNLHFWLPQFVVDILLMCCYGNRGHNFIKRIERLLFLPSIPLQAMSPVSPHTCTSKHHFHSFYSCNHLSCDTFYTMLPDYSF